MGAMRAADAASHLGPHRAQRLGGEGQAQFGIDPRDLAFPVLAQFVEMDPRDWPRKRGQCGLDPGVAQVELAPPFGFDPAQIDRIGLDRHLVGDD